MRKVTNYYLAQFGGTADDATKDLQSGSADATNWLRSALGMAMSGQLDQYDAAPAATTAPASDTTSADAAQPAAKPVVREAGGYGPTHAANWRQRYMAQQAQGAHLRSF